MDTTLVLKEGIKFVLMKAFSSHRSDGRSDIFIFSTPRSGSTWLMELIMSQPGFKYCDEPFNLRTFPINKQLDMSGWSDIYSIGATEAIEPYIRSFQNGSRPCYARIKHSLPFGKDYRYKTSRIVFKILHACEDQLNWFQRTFGGNIIFMLRHPIPVSLSRKVLPRLEWLINSDYKRHFSTEQLKFARHIIEQGSRMEKGVLSWALQNAVPLQQAQPDWLIVSYEELVLNPKPVIEMLAQKCDLPYPERMTARLTVPSETTWQSDKKTQEVLNSILDQSKHKYLVERWRTKVSADEEQRLMSILDSLDIDAYTVGSPLPTAKYWLS